MAFLLRLIIIQQQLVSGQHGQGDLRVNWLTFATCIHFAKFIFFAINYFHGSSDFRQKFVKRYDCFIFLMNGARSCNSKSSGLRINLMLTKENRQTVEKQWVLLVMLLNKYEQTLTIS